MADKYPEDMTASELLREAVAVSESATGYWTPIGELFLLLDTCFSDGQEDLFRALADKIDAEIVKAYSEKLDTCAMRWAKANCWPDFREGEDFGAWLERCALPRPRFEDGEPVHIGDKAEHPYTGETCTIDCINTFDDSYCLGFVEERSAALCDGERVKRPAPEVLGADGLPIKVGDAMWSLSGAGPLTVTSLHTDDPTPDGGDSPRADLDDDGLYSWIYAGSLTHTPPDTQQAIDDDATMPPAEYCAVRGIDLGDDPDRETATEAMVRDLLLRQRELDRKGGE